MSLARRLLPAVAALGLLFSRVAGDAAVFTNVTSYNNLDAFDMVSPFQEYKSHPGLKSPIFLSHTFNLSLASDEPYLFLAMDFTNTTADGDDDDVVGSDGRKGSYSPYIFNSTDLSLVYAEPQFQSVFDARAQLLDGELFLTFWHGDPRSGGQADGFCVFYDKEYKLRYNVTTEDPGPAGSKGAIDGIETGEITALADLHEVQVTRDDTVLFAIYNPITFDMTPLGGSAEEPLMDSLFQEVDPKTGEVIFTWSAAAHFRPQDSLVPYADGASGVGGAGYDFFHINSVDKTRSGDYLVSSRHLSVLTLVSGDDGKPIWVMGGLNDAINQFVEKEEGGTALDFGYQHDARFFDQEETEITMFDNRIIGGGGVNCTGERCSRGLHIRIDVESEPMTAEIVREYYHPVSNYTSGAMGGFQGLPNGNFLTGWGTNPSVVEFTRDGDVALDVQISASNPNATENPHWVYRAFKMGWEGRPTWDPRMLAERSEDSRRNVRVYASWNGATEISEWVVHGSDQENFEPSEDNEIARKVKIGFETLIFLGGKRDAPQFLRLAAVDSSGDILGSSNVADVDAADLNDKAEPSDEDDSSGAALRPPGENNDGGSSDDNKDEDEDGAGASQVGGWTALVCFALAIFMTTL